MPQHFFSLFEFGLHCWLLIFIQQFLSHCFLWVRIGGVLSEVCPLEDGVPQGSILCVTLFAVAIKCHHWAPRRSWYLIRWRLVNLPSAVWMPLIERKLQLSVNMISHWASTWGFRFSALKTVAIHFCCLRSVHSDPDLYLYDRRISCVEETCFLWLIFDSLFTWVPHLCYIKAASIKALSLIKVLAHTSWDADR